MSREVRNLELKAKGGGMKKPRLFDGGRTVRDRLAAAHAGGPDLEHANRAKKIAAYRRTVFNRHGQRVRVTVPTKD